MEETNRNMMRGEGVPKLYKRIGKTVYEIGLHFNESSVDTVHDKLKRIIVNDYTYKKMQSD